VEKLWVKTDDELELLRNCGRCHWGRARREWRRRCDLPGRKAGVCWTGEESGRGVYIMTWKAGRLGGGLCGAWFCDDDWYSGERGSMEEAENGRKWWAITCWCNFWGNFVTDAVGGHSERLVMTYRRPWREAMPEDMQCACDDGREGGGEERRPSWWRIQSPREAACIHYIAHCSMRGLEALLMPHEEVFSQRRGHSDGGSVQYIYYGWCILLKEGSTEEEESIEKRRKQYGWREDSGNVIEVVHYRVMQ